MMMKMKKKKENPVHVGYIYIFCFRFLGFIFIFHVFSLGKFHCSGTEFCFVVLLFCFIFIFSWVEPVTNCKEFLLMMVLVPINSFI